MREVKKLTERDVLEIMRDGIPFVTGAPFQTSVIEDESLKAEINRLIEKAHQCVNKGSTTKRLRKMIEGQLGLIKADIERLEVYLNAVKNPKEVPAGPDPE